MELTKISFEDKLKNYLKKNAHKDFIVYRLPVKTRPNMVSDFELSNRITVVCAQNAIDMKVSMVNLEKKGAVPVAGNFPNIKDKNGKVNDRVAELKEAYEHRQALMGNLKREIEPTIKEQIADKESEKLAEVKERLGKKTTKAESEE